MFITPLINPNNNDPKLEALWMFINSSNSNIQTLPEFLEHWDIKKYLHPLAFWEAPYCKDPVPRWSGKTHG